MNEFVRKFKISNHELELLVQEIRNSDFKTEEGQSVLMSSRDFILSHFNRLSHDYCIGLTQLAEIDPPLARVMKLFATDMQLISQSLKEFFLRYEYSEHTLEYAAEYGRIYAMLAHSVHKQRTITRMFDRFEIGISGSRTAGAAI